MARASAIGSKVGLCGGRAQFYAGEWQLLRGDRAAAAAALKMAVETCPKSFIEFKGAKAELTRIGP